MRESDEMHRTRAGPPRDRRPAVGYRGGRGRRLAFSLTELMIVVALIGIFVAMSVPSFQRSMEQSKADMAAANLRAIWTAQRLYWLEYRSYTDDLSELESLDLVAPIIVAAAEPYRYEIPAADATSFSVVATRSGSGKWFGRLVIDETGIIRGEITAGGRVAIQPGFL